MPGYLINNTIFFDTESGLLYRLPDAASGLTLNAVTARCLEVLLQERGNTVSRDRLLDAGWGTAGVVVASNSLSQVISLLRRGFRSLGCEEEVIATVSREGYRISPAISVEAVTQPLPESDVPAEVLHTPETSVVSPPPRFQWRTPVVGTGVFLLAALLGVFMLPGQQDPYEIYGHSDQGATVLVQKNRSHRFPVEDQMALLNTDADLKAAAAGKPFIYFNNQASSYIDSYFLCSAPISKKGVSCEAYNIIREPRHEG